MLKKELDSIKSLRTYGFPLWAIKICLEMNNYDYENSFKQLKEIYFVIGDNPNAIVERREKELRNKYQKEDK